VRFLYGDSVEYLRRGVERRFDVLWASTALYQQRDPVEMIALAAGACRSIFGWTHYYDPDIIQATPPLAAKFTARIAADHAGFAHQLHRYEYGAAPDDPASCGGKTEFSHWLERADLLACLRHVGFDTIEIGFDHPDHPNGPSLAFVATRRS
jgi:hypothetical protein